MEQNIEPFWYRIISNYLEKGIIFNGLTIPYLIGAKRLTDSSVNIDEGAIERLLNEIITAKVDDVATLIRCDYLQEYVVSLMNRNEANRNFKTESMFYNSQGNLSFVITKQTALKLGDSITDVSKKLNDLYLPILLKSKFSRNGPTKNWNKFSEIEINRIKSL